MVYDKKDGFVSMTGFINDDKDKDKDSANSTVESNVPFDSYETSDSLDFTEFESFFEEPEVSKEETEVSPEDSRYDERPLDDFESISDIINERPEPILSLNSKDSKFRKILSLILASAILVSLVFGMFYVYDAGKGDNSEPVVVVKQTSILKEEPIDPKGMEIEYLDKVVYGVVDGEKKQEEKIERLLPMPEKPIIIEKAIIDKIKSSTKVYTINKTVINKKKTTVKVVPKKVLNKKKITVKVVNTITKPIGWKIQLASVGSNAQAKSTFKKLYTKYNVLKNAKLFIEKAEVNGKIYHRVQAVGFSSKTLAIKICNAIKANGGSCLVKK